MLEVYVLVPVKKKFITLFLGVLCFVLAIGSLVMACISVVFSALVLVFGALGWYFLFATNKEFEYSYFDGEVRFARVMNKSRRKRLAVYTMDEVVQIAPAGDRSISNYERDSSIKVKDYTSNNKNTPYYEMVVRSNDAVTLIKFEPDDQYLDAVMVKYAQKVVRRPE